jgi:hypothetical protein
VVHGHLARRVHRHVAVPTQDPCRTGAPASPARRRKPI